MTDTLKIIADREHKKGDIIHWSGVYTWFKSPVSDDDDLLLSAIILWYVLLLEFPMNIISSSDISS